MKWKKMYESKLVSVEEAASKIESGDTIWMPSASSAPVDLANALENRYKELENVDLISGLVTNPFRYLTDELKGHINGHTWFVGGYERKGLKSGNLDAASVNLSKLHIYAENKNCNVLMAEVSQPDEDGYMSYGPLGAMGNDGVAKKAEKIIVQVNKNTPYVHGVNNKIHVSKVDYICEKDHPLSILPNAPTTETDEKIASYILPLIPDGATIQIGIGGTANAVAYGLEDKKDLGVHTEMLTDSMVYLAKKGVINNSKKNYMPGKMVISFGVGSQELYDFMDDNPLIHMDYIKTINDANEIAKNDNFISINSGLMVDLTGQVGSEGIGYNQYSATGGQLDFVRGAAMSKGGKSFLCLHSTVKTKDGIKSRINLALPQGTPITTPRSDTQYLVTEYGVAYVYCKSISERAKAIINIAHPDFREELTQQAIEAGLIKE
ncbi:acetyl-CoA hydrolase/transferase C-terminal domain-containing protein [Clostridium sediminicola]|uniref:acetyl-CoA hydrolase/transferase family protein n=1 Tax=Clostridium sediminicola TaxID=3114879 RepID=UPI0031F22B3F